MALVLTSGPATEPVTVAEAKAHLRIDSAAEDLLLASLIITSRLQIEAGLGLALITQVWRETRDALPCNGVIELPLSPVKSVDLVRIVTADGTWSVLPPSAYDVDTASRPARVVRAATAVWPIPGRVANGVEITFTAGFGAHGGDVPAPLKQALLMLVAHWYEHRDPSEIGTAADGIPAQVSALIAPYKVKRL